MTATGTEIATRRAIGELPAEIQQAIELRKMRNLVASQIAGMSWGEKLDGETRRAVAAWGQQFRVDVVTEIHVLGGRVYPAAAYYLRRLGEMIAADLVQYAVADHVEDDPRLKEIGAEGEGEYSRRLRERIMHAIPDKAASAVVFRVKLRSMDREVIGVKWCGNGTRKGDPVGDQFPVESSETRAARRAMRLLVSHVPAEIRESFESVDRAAEALSARIVDAKARVKVQEAELNVPAGAVLQSPDPADPYQLGAGEVGPSVISPHVLGVVERHMEKQERGELVSEAGEARSQSQLEKSASVTPPVSAPAPATASSRVKLPFGMGAAKVGTPLRDVSTADLSDALVWAKKNGKFLEFVEAASIELDDRRTDDDEGER